MVTDDLYRRLVPCSLLIVQQLGSLSALVWLLAFQPAYFFRNNDWGTLCPRNLKAPAEVDSVEEWAEGREGSVGPGESHHEELAT